jgi:hypothetical protein
MTTAALYDMIKDQGALFNVATIDLQTIDGVRIPNKRAIVNAETHQPLGIVGNKYKVVTNAEVVTSMLESIETANLDVTDATVRVQSAKGGARTLIDIVLPAYSMMAGKNETVMRISTLNSYDGSWLYTSKAGGIRMACANGQVIGNIIGTYKQRHNSMLDVKRGAEHLVNMIGEFNQSEELFQRMISTKIDGAQVITAIGRFIGKLDSNRPATEVEAEAISTHRVGKALLDRYDAYAIEMGHNMYALYNAFTDYITHKKRGADTAATSVTFDEQKLSHMIDQKVFA